MRLAEKKAPKEKKYFFSKKEVAFKLFEFPMSSVWLVALSVLLSPIGIKTFSNGFGKSIAVIYCLYFKISP